MVIFVGDLEDCRAIESWFDDHFAPLSVFAPQFQLPTVFAFPVFVQVNQKRKTPNEPGRVSCVTVDMNIELPAPRNEMVSGSLQVGIGQQLPNPRNFRKKVKKFCGMQKCNMLRAGFPEIYSR